jgi:hypothetical protein
MKSLYKVLLVATMLFNTSIASAAYVVTNSQTGNFTPGYVSGSIESLYLIGSNGALSPSPNVVTYTDTFLSDTTLSFDWTYQTFDTGGSTRDKAGYVINNTFTQLSKDGLTNSTVQSGSVLISIMANDIFGLYIDSVDSRDNFAYLSVTNYSATPATPSAVPVPAALPLMASALVAFGISRRSKVKAKLNLKV